MAWKIEHAVLDRFYSWRRRNEKYSCTCILDQICTEMNRNVSETCKQLSASELNATTNAQHDMHVPHSPSHRDGNWAPSLTPRSSSQTAPNQCSGMFRNVSECIECLFWWVRMQPSVHSYNEKLEAGCMEAGQLVGDCAWLQCFDIFVCMDGNHAMLRCVSKCIGMHRMHVSNIRIGSDGMENWTCSGAGPLL